MRRSGARCLFAGALALCIGCGGSPPSELFPPVEPTETGYLRVDETHELYWETIGNRQGIPVIVLHGGPGGSASPETRRLFDPERFFVLLFDQRGAYRSRPQGEWRDNTTAHLVEDINRLRDHVGLTGPVLLFGGSWGATLALAYAEKYPERVNGLVLRGVFLGSSEEIDYLYHGGAGAFFPETWERLRNLVPQPDVPDYPRQLFEMISGGGAKDREAAIEGWAYYEIRMSSLEMTDDRAEQAVRDYHDQLMPFSLLENYYMMNGCFLDDRQLLDHADRIADIPTFIVHGRYDAICRPVVAWSLAQRLDNVELVFTHAGHSQSDPANTDALLAGLDWVADRIEADGLRPQIADR
ncbi:MAG TPA: prolyl aminopeptidase [Candidatus Polarisedimenticolaceae bacterium]|nr:prolyl aminopeptidase [Candidatus Polarisedimenticolaceae bacterium]